MVFTLCYKYVKQKLYNKKIKFMITIVMIIIGVVCLLGLAYITSKEKWDKYTRPPKGWTQHNGIRTIINKP